MYHTRRTVLSGPVVVAVASVLVCLFAAVSQAAVTSQDFDGGGTPYVGVQHGTAPPPAVTGGGPTGSFLRIAKDGEPNQQNTVAFDRTHLAGYTGVSGQFDFRMGGGGDGADGMGFAMLNTGNFGTSGGLTSFFSEEPNLTNSFGIGFDTHDNGGGDLSQDSVSLHFNGAKVAEVDLSGQIDLENNVFNRADLTIQRATDNSGSFVSLDITADIHGIPGTPIDVFDEEFIPGMAPYESRLGFSARTGGLNDNHDIDNVNFDFDAGLPPIEPPPPPLEDITRPGDPLIRVDGVNDGDPNGGDPPPGEVETHAIDDVGQKYLNFKDLGSGFAVTPSEQPWDVGVAGLRLYTANDQEPRDPASYELYGSNGDLATGPWTLISAGQLALPSGRNAGGNSVSIPPTGNFAAAMQEILFDFVSPHFEHYRVIFPTLKNAGAANSMQIGEVELLGDTTIIPESSALLVWSVLAILCAGVFPCRRRR